MALTPEDVDHIASLARLGITADERARLTTQLSGILEHFQVLQQLDTSQIPPTAQNLDLRNVMRADETRPSLPLEDVLRNAPQREGDFFRIQAVLEE